MAFPPTKKKGVVVESGSSESEESTSSESGDSTSGSASSSESGETTSSSASESNPLQMWAKRRGK